MLQIFGFSSIGAISVIQVLCIIHSSLAEVERSDKDDETTSKPRMWKGNVTHYSKHPYFALLTQKVGYFMQPFCGAALITPVFAITAAHCVFNKEPKRLRVRYGINVARYDAGTSRKFGDGFNHVVSRVFIHPLYRDSAPWASVDLALLMLQKPIEHEGFLLHLPEPGEDQPFIDSNLTSTLVAIGSSEGNDPGKILKEAEFSLLHQGWRQGGYAYRCFHPSAVGTTDKFMLCGKNEPTFGIRPGI